MTAVAFLLTLILAAVLCAGTAWNGSVVLAKNETRTIYFCDGSNQSNPRQFNFYASVGFRFTVPEGYKLDTFSLIASPTWGTQDNAGFTADIYAWQGSYAATLDSRLLGTDVITHHSDNAPVDIHFGYIPEGSYLIHIHSYTAPIGTWESMALPAEYTDSWAYYQDGIEETDYLPGTAITVSVNNAPPVITDPPEATETPEATEEVNTVNDVPEATSRAHEHTAPAATGDPANTPAARRTSALPGILVGAVLLAAAALVIALVSRRDRKAHRER